MKSLLKNKKLLLSVSFVFGVFLIFQIALGDFVGPGSLIPGQGGGLFQISPTGSLLISANTLFSSNVNVVGNIQATGTIEVTGGGFKGNGSLVSGLTASQIGADIFSSGNFAFQSGLAIGTTTIVGLPTKGLYIDGNLGIGTLNPIARLELAGTAPTTQSGGKKYIGLSDKVFLGDPNISNTLGIFGKQNPKVASIRLGDTGGIISGFDDKIGIGTTTPEAIVDIRDEGVFESPLLGIGSGAFFTDVHLKNTLGLYGKHNTSISSLKLGSGGSVISGAEGNLGINVINPKFQLDLDGAMRIRPSVTPSAPQNGVIYYNNTEGKFKCYENNIWKDCISFVRGDSIGGNGVVNYVPIFNSSNTLSSSQLFFVDGILQIEGGGPFRVSTMIPQGGNSIVELGASSNGGYVGSVGGNKFSLAIDSSPKLTVNSNGNIGINNMIPKHTLDVQGAYYSRLVSKGSSGANGTIVTIDWNQGNTQHVNLTGNTTFAFQNGQSGGRYALMLKQGSGGSKLVTWPSGVVLWPAGGSAPVLTTNQGYTDYIEFIYGADGKYYGIVFSARFFGTIIP